MMERDASETSRQRGHRHLRPAEPDDNWDRAMSPAAAAAKKRVEVVSEMVEIRAQMVEAERLVGLWDRWQSTGGPSAGLDIWEWSTQAVATLRKLTPSPD